MKNKVYCENCIHLKEFGLTGCDYFYRNGNGERGGKLGDFDFYCNANSEPIYEDEKKKHWLRPKVEVGTLVEDPSVKNVNNDCKDFKPKLKNKRFRNLLLPF